MLRGQILSPLVGDAVNSDIGVKVDEGIGQRVTHGKCVGVDSGVSIR